MPARLVEVLENMPFAARGAAAASATLLIAWLDAASGDLPCSVLYLAPLALLAWGDSTGRGVAAAAAMAAARLTVLAVRGTASPLRLLWATAAWLACYAVFALLVVSLHRARARLADQALVDPLTGLGNRRALLRALTREQARLRRTSIPLTLSCIEIDGLARVEHERDLQHAAAALREGLRETDMLVRLSGGEFALLLPETDAIQARTALQKVRSALGCRSLEARVSTLTCASPDLAPEAMLSSAVERLRGATPAAGS